MENQLNKTVPKLKSAEKLAQDFPDNVDKILPEAGALESAKAYREKKAKPVLEKATRLVKSLYRSVLDLQAENRELRAKNESWFCCCTTALDKNDRLGCRTDKPPRSLTEKRTVMCG